MRMFVPVMSAGIKSGVELHPVERQIQHPRERPHQQCFSQARHPFQQRMAAGQQADQNPVHNVRVADNHFAAFGPHPRKLAFKLRNCFLVDVHK